MIVAAFDLSLVCSGWAIGSAGKLLESGRIETIPIKGMTEVQQVERCIFIRNAVLTRIERSGAGVVVFEDFAHAAKGASLHQLAGSAMMIRAELIANNDLPYMLVAPSTLKKFIVGRGGSPKNPVPKEIVIRDLYRNFGFEAQENNEADAVGLAYLGLALFGAWEPRIQGQREVVAALTQKYSNIVKGAVS